MIRVGIGGWTYAPWRDNFYPRGLVQKGELSYASRQVTTIEINSTFYRAATPASFAKWRDETPDDFVFAVKASRYATHRSALAESGDSIARFFDSGLSELGHKLGPILWQFPPGKQFDAADFERFLALLPSRLGGQRLRHALDARNESFGTPAFVALARRYGAAIVFSDTDKFPVFADLTSDCVYARLMRSETAQPTGYPVDALSQWARRARVWAHGDDPEDLPHVGRPATTQKARDVFIYVISGAKDRAPAAARALLARLETD